MKTLNIQIQDGIPPLENLPLLLGKIAQIGSDHEATEAVSVASGDDSGAYYNLTIESKDLGALWPLLRDEVAANHQIRIIVTCEGEDGWNDYLLLYHYDKSEVVDTLT